MPSGFPSISDRLLRRATYGAALGWLAMLFLHQGMPDDEAEHAHAAWLIAVKGWVPLRDFFQHHTRLLWDVIGLYFRLGGEGPTSLLAGRLLVVLASLMTLFGLHRLAAIRGGRDAYPFAL